MVQVIPTRRLQVQECEVANCTCKLKTVHLFNEDNNILCYCLILYREKEYKQVIKTFSKNVEGCRDGSAKNHRN